MQYNQKSLSTMKPNGLAVSVLNFSVQREKQVRCRLIEDKLADSTVSFEGMVQVKLDVSTKPN